MHTGNSGSVAPVTNATLWKFNTGGQVGSPTVVDGVVYVGSYDRKIYAFDASDGSVLWSYATGGIVVSRPAVVNGVVYVGANVFVEKDSQKGIVIGRKGRMLRQIGSTARREIERMTGGQVYLDLWVKVRKGWRRDEKELRRLGYVEGG